MDITIKTVPAIDTQAWPNEIAVGYLTGWMRRYDAIFTEQYPAPAKLQPYLTDAKTLVQKLLDDYKESTVSPQTQQIDEADKARDVRVDQVNTMVNAMLKMVGMPQMQQAAQKVKAGLDLYKPSLKAALRDESTQIQQWLQLIDEDVQQDQAIQTLGLKQIVQELEQYNNEVIRLMDLRATERQYRKSIVIADDRKAADRATKNCDRMLSALALVDDDPRHFEALVERLTADQTEWRQRYDAHQRTAKRVSVKSSVVGNHLYSTARGWTWSQLIDDGKALLTIDDEQPDRIVSTDKKAVKAGGLFLALNGVAVKPTDDVDAEKEYQLISIDSSSDGGSEVTPVTPVTPE